jgi:hypothetical protein
VCDQLEIHGIFRGDLRERTPCGLLVTSSGLTTRVLTGLSLGISKIAAKRELRSRSMRWHLNGRCCEAKASLSRPGHVSVSVARIMAANDLILLSKRKGWPAGVLQAGLVA